MKEKIAKTKKYHDNFFKKRRYCFEPIEEIFEAACLLDKAVDMHLDERYADAEKLIKLADNWKICHWSEILWGNEQPWLQRFRYDPEKPSGPKNEQTIPKEIEQEVIRRDGYFCKYCRIPVIASGVRKELRKFYPETLRWGPINEEQHSAFQAMRLYPDHIMPQAVGGENVVENLVVSCGPCNSAKYKYTLIELGLANPLNEPTDSEQYSKSWGNEWKIELNRYWKKYQKINWDKEQWDGLARVFRTGT